MRPLTAPAWLLAVAAVAAVAVVAAVIGTAVEAQRGFTDLAVYRFGGSEALAGLGGWIGWGPGAGPGLYVGADPATGLPFTYPPFAALLMVGVALLPAVVAAGLWAAASVLALAGVVRLFLAEGAPRPPRGAAVLTLTVAMLLLEPVWSGLSFGQVNLFLALAISLDLLRPDRRWAGVLVGVAAGIKLTPLVFVVLLVLVGRRAAAGRAVAAFAGTVVIGFALLPSAATSYWTDVLWDPGRVGGVAYAGNQSLLGALTRLLGHEPATLLWLAVAGLVSVAVLLVAAAWWRRGRRDLGVLLGAASMLLASPVSWSHHWVWAAPALIVLWRRASATVPALAAAIAVTLVATSACIWWPPHRSDQELAWSWPEQVVGNAYVWTALLLATYAAVRLAPRRDRSTPPPRRPAAPAGRRPAR
ncbi:hypothetical protein GCM10027026_23890 [Myroides odoratimimus subsp. xuanwuensis]